MSRYVTGLLIIALTALTVVVCANTVTVSAGSQLGITIDSSEPVVKLTDSAAVRGDILMQPSKALPGGEVSFSIDGSLRHISDLRMPDYALNTRSLADGIHEVRLDWTEGGRLLASTGSIPLHVYNSTSQALFSQARGPAAPDFFKLKRKVMKREIVWFNGREADLEKHGFIRNKRVYITLTDLIRHIGGGIIWGPSQDYIEVHRNNMVVRVFPHSSRILVDGNPRHLDRATTRKQNRLYVPVRPMCELFGVGVDWEKDINRALVNFSG
ncbi:MAG: stalk domain-containing protein [Armatimonadota bacterium]